MGTLVVQDARELIIPLFSVEAKDDGVLLGSRIFLGTAFFVTKCGDAITASHILPKPNELGTTKRIVAIVQCGDEHKVCWITHAAIDKRSDLALIHVNLQHTKYLDLSEEDVSWGADIQIIGVPSHEVWNSGKEMRILKGHVTLAHKYLELNIPVPAGMSGSPVFLGAKVVGCATGVVRSEELEDYVEEVELISNKKEQIRITQTSRVIHYGLAVPFSGLRKDKSPIFDGHTLFSFVSARNAQG